MTEAQDEIETKPLKIELRWEGNAKHQWLFVGENPTELVWLEKRTKLWSAAIWLPGISPGREFNTLEAHKRNLEEKVRHWFEQALRGASKEKELCDNESRPLEQQTPSEAWDEPNDPGTLG